MRSINPWVPQSSTQLVVDGLRSRGLEAHVCGSDFESLEVWFYPLFFSYGFGGTQYWITAQRIPGGVGGTVQTNEAVYAGSSWEMSVHPNGGVWTVKRMQGVNLRSEARSMGKWIRKNTPVQTRP